MAPESTSHSSNGNNGVLETGAVDKEISDPARVRRVSFAETTAPPRAEAEASVTEIVADDTVGDEVVGEEKNFVPPLRGRGGPKGSSWIPYQLFCGGCLSPDVEAGLDSSQERGAQDADGNEGLVGRGGRREEVKSNGFRGLKQWFKPRLMSPVLVTRLTMMVRPPPPALVH